MKYSERKTSKQQNIIQRLLACLLVVLLTGTMLISAVATGTDYLPDPEGEPVSTAADTPEPAAASSATDPENASPSTEDSPAQETLCTENGSETPSSTNEIMLLSEDVCQIGSTGYGTLAEAIAAAQDGDTIEMLVSALPIDSAMTISGKAITIQALDGGTALSMAVGTADMFTVDADAGLTLSGMTLSGASQADTRGVVVSGSLVLSDATIEGFGNSATISGGGVTANAGSTVHMTGASAITNCTGDKGAGLYAAGATLTVEDTSSITACTGNRGAAMYLDGTTAMFGGNCEISGNTGADTAVIDLSNGTALLIGGNTLIRNNTGNGTASAISMRANGNPSTLTMCDNARLTENHAVAPGAESTTIGCQPDSGQIFFLDNSAMNNNTAASTADGASAIHLPSGVTLHIQSGSISGNRSTSSQDAAAVTALAGSRIEISGSAVISGNFNTVSGTAMNLKLASDEVMLVTEDVREGALIGVTAPGYMAAGDAFGTYQDAAGEGLGHFYQDTNTGASTDLFGAPGENNTIVWGSYTMQVEKVTVNLPAEQEFTFRVRAYDPDATYQVVFDLLADLLQDPTSKAYEYYLDRKTGQMDSTGVNYGQYVKAELIRRYPALRSKAFYFYTDRYYKGSSFATDKFRFLYADADAGAISVGDTVNVYQYDNGTGKFTKALGIVGEKIVNSTNIKYIESIVPSSETDLSPLANINETITLKNGEASSLYGPLPYGVIYHVEELDENTLTTVTVTNGETHELDGKLVSGTIPSDTVITYTNRGTPSVALQAQKKLDDAAPDEETFSFSCTPVWGTSGGETIDLAAIDSYVKMPATTAQNVAGAITFPTFRFLCAGTYLFRLGEDADPSGLYDSDPAVYFALVTVDTENSPSVRYYAVWDGTDVAGLSMEETLPVFHNYSKRGLVVKKTVTGTLGDRDKAFSFFVQVDKAAYAMSETVFGAFSQMLQDKTYLKGSEATNRMWKYYYSDKKTGDLDSNGTNYGVPICAQLNLAFPLLENTAYSWKVTKKASGTPSNFENDSFYYYLCEMDISAMAVGATVALDRYDTDTGTMVTGTAKIKKNAQGVMVFDTTTFVPGDGIPAKILHQDGTVEAVSLEKNGSVVQLRDGEQLQIPDLSYATQYVIVETNAGTDGYATTVVSTDSATEIEGGGASGALTENGLTTLTYTNCRDAIAPTGFLSSLSAMGLLTAMALAGFAVAGIRLFRKRKRHP